jgi:hypothetical protein
MTNTQIEGMSFSSELWLHNFFALPHMYQGFPCIDVPFLKKSYLVTTLRARLLDKGFTQGVMTRY